MRCEVDRKTESLVSMQAARPRVSNTNGPSLGTQGPSTHRPFTYGPQASPSPKPSWLQGPKPTQTSPRERWMLGRGDPGHFWAPRAGLRNCALRGPERSPGKEVGWGRR